MGKKRRLKNIVTIGIPKNPHTELEIREMVTRFISSGRYIPTHHAKERLDKREVTIQEVRSILLDGERERKKDEYKEFDDRGNKIERWSYAFRGKTIDARSLRVCVSILCETEKKPLLIITVITDP